MGTVGKSGLSPGAATSVFVSSNLIGTSLMGNIAQRLKAPGCGPGYPGSTPGVPTNTFWNIWTKSINVPMPFFNIYERKYIL